MITDQLLFVLYAHIFPMVFPVCLYFLDGQFICSQWFVQYVIMFPVVCPLCPHVPIGFFKYIHMLPLICLVCPYVPYDLSIMPKCSQWFVHCVRVFLVVCPVCSNALRGLPSTSLYPFHQTAHDMTVHSAICRIQACFMYEKFLLS